jgi:hypothetical protein
LCSWCRCPSPFVAPRPPPARQSPQVVWENVLLAKKCPPSSVRAAWCGHALASIIDADQERNILRSTIHTRRRATV